MFMTCCCLKSFCEVMEKIKSLLSMKWKEIWKLILSFRLELPSHVKTIVCMLYCQTRLFTALQKEIWIIDQSTRTAKITNIWILKLGNVIVERSMICFLFKFFTLRVFISVRQLILMCFFILYISLSNIFLNLKRVIWRLLIL